MSDKNASTLIGKTIAAIKIAADKRAMRIEFTDGSDAIARADGDCCSETWIEHIELPALGFPATITGMDDLNMGKPDEGKRGYSVTCFYGYKITTDKGEIVIDYRNESNGYYGGSLAWPGDYFYGGVFGQCISKEEWQEIAQ